MNEQIWIVSMDEPVYYGRLYCRLIEKHPEAFAGIVLMPSDSLLVGRSLWKEISYRWRFWGPRAFIYFSVRWLRAKLAGSGNLRKMARSKDVPLFEATTLDDLDEVLAHHVPSLVLATVGTRVPSSLLKTVSAGWVNTHCGPLPKYRGVDAPFWCLLHDEADLAVTLHLMDAEFDSGPILSQSTISSAGMSYATAVDRLFDLAFSLHCDVLRDPTRAIENAASQERTGGSYFPRPPISAGREFRRKGRFV